MKVVLPYLSGLPHGTDFHIHFIRNGRLISEGDRSIPLSTAIRNGWEIKVFII